jgi:hypothetical protein
MTDFFRRWYEAPADQGATTEEPPEEPDDEGGEEGEEEEAPRYTMDEFAEALGPRFQERFAGSHEGLEAARKFAESYENATSLIAKGAHLEPQDEALYESLGIQPPEPQPEEEHYEPIYGTPWADPTNWDELVDLSQRNPRAAAEFALNQPDFPDETKAWFFANWASVDAAGAFAYNQAATTAAAKQYADEQTAEIRQQVEPLVQDHMTRNATLLIDRAKETIQGFAEHGMTISKLMDERQQRDSRYHDWFLHASLDQQLQELRDLTGVAIFRAQPEAEAEAEADLEETEQSKKRSKTETTRTSGTREQPTPQSEMKKKNLAQFQKLKEQGLLG